MIAKREGELEPFDLAKLRRCLAAAMRTRRCDERLADELARAIQLHVRDGSQVSSPDTDYVFRCVRTALTQTGMGAVAQLLSRHRRRRAQRRQSLSVIDTRNPQRAPMPWRKAAIATALESHHGLGRAVARILAAEIERRVLALEYAVVSTTLIRELTRSELSAWGLLDVQTNSARQAPERDEVAVARPQAKKEC